MTLPPRAKLVLLVAIFILPIAASVIAYNFANVKPTANYGELLQPPAAADPQPFLRAPGTAFRFSELSGRWVLVASDTAGCAEGCVERLRTVRQVRLALGRDASRVERVFVAVNGPAPVRLPDDLAGTIAVVPAPGTSPSPAVRDAAHIYLVDPNGNVMMRWPAQPDRRRMLKDLQRLLKASQLG
jgi:cytochrome oxidase Cu insertion factor (SCO1/SenC/PrrC family)